MFELMLIQLRESVSQTLSFVDISTPVGAQDAILGAAPDPSKIKETRTDPAMMGTGLSAPQAEPQRAAPVRNLFDKNDPKTWASVSRNAPCPCGSGKKYKYCHGRVGD